MMLCVERFYKSMNGYNTTEKHVVWLLFFKAALCIWGGIIQYNNPSLKLLCDMKR